MPDHSPHEKICERCDSAYWITSKHVPMRDEDSVKCEVCGKELIRWNEARIYEVRLGC